jgi:hypothetical protein
MPEEYIKKQRKRIAEVAQTILKGEVGIVAASRELTSLRHEAQVESDDDLTVFRVVDSETDYLPVGSQRENYRQEKLLELDQELSAHEDFYKNDVIEACRNLIRKYK